MSSSVKKNNEQNNANVNTSNIVIDEQIVADKGWKKFEAFLY